MLGLLRSAAIEQPVLCVVDDAAWMDGSTLECVSYAARRCGSGVGFVLSARTGDCSIPQLSDLPRLVIGPLDEPTSRLLLARCTDLDPKVAEEMLRVAVGNPLALLELPLALTAHERGGLTRLPALPPLGERLQAGFTARLHTLSRKALDALAVAALHDSEDLVTVAAACRYLGTDVGQLVRAEAIGVVRLHAGRVTFRHPLLRAAVCTELDAAGQRAVHAALARALTGERAAWHLGAATILPEESVAATLETAASSAAARRGFASAAAVMERAAELSPKAADRGRRFLAAGRTAAAAGQPSRALVLLERAMSGPAEGLHRAEAQHLRGGILTWMGRVREAAELLTEEGARCPSGNATLAATMLADAATARTATNQYTMAEGLARRAAGLLDDTADELSRAHVLGILAYVLALRGMTADSAAIMREVGSLTPDIDPLVPGRTWLHTIDRTWAPTGDLSRARHDSATLCERAREAGALTVLAGALTVAADAALRIGDWAAADRESLEALQVSRDAGHEIWYGLALAIRTRLCAARGQGDDARVMVEGMRALAIRSGASSGWRFTLGGLGFLELGLGKAQEAVAALEELRRRQQGSGMREATIVPWVPDLTEAYLRVGRRDDARLLVKRFVKDTAGGPPTARALSSRCLGITAECDYDEHFAASLAWDDVVPVPFERGRTLLAHGRRLHRDRRRAEARHQLQAAVELFAGLGAGAWVEQTEGELSAAGAKRRPHTGDALTRQERRVAREVARGASNSAVASTLFLSPKTVEFHLANIHRKLGIASRPELVAALLGDFGELVAGNATPTNVREPREMGHESQ